MKTCNSLIPFLSLIVPTYNERENLPLLVERIHKSLKKYNYELIVVDDDSPDETAKVAETLSNKYPIKVIHRKGEKGLASAVVIGFNIARGKILGVIDADLQHPPEKIPDFLISIENGTDVVIGSRYISKRIIKWNIRRRIMSIWATIIARLFLPSVRKIKDPLSGFFVLKKEVIQDIKLKPIGYKILLEILVKGKVKEVKEIPYTFKERKQGKSKLDIREQINYLQHILILIVNEKEIRRFIKFCFVGLSGVIVNIVVFWFFTRVIGLYDLIVLFISTEASILSNFILNDLWTFKDKRKKTQRVALSSRVLKFNIISLFAVIIYYTIYTSLTRLWEIYDLIALLLAIGSCTIWNFTMNSLWTWREK